MFLIKSSTKYAFVSVVASDYEESNIVKLESTNSNIYALDDIESTLTINMYISVIGACDNFVEDTNKELPELCRRFYDYPHKKLHMISVGGTDGKTSTATIIQALLSKEECGYIGTNFWSEGRTQEIKERVLHL